VGKWRLGLRILASAASAGYGVTRVCKLRAWAMGRPGQDQQGTGCRLAAHALIRQFAHTLVTWYDTVKASYTEPGSG
jgi:hypothetical protein